MQKLFRIILALPAILFLAMGVRWLVDPAGMANQLGVVLGDGAGRTSQIADFGAFFLTLGLCILLGVVTQRRLWFYPAVLLLLLAAVGRLLAWVLHDGAFTGGPMVVEIVVAALLLAAARWLPERA